MEHSWIHICVSSSIENFREKLKNRFDAPEWSLKTIYKPAVFFGMYHKGDYLRYLIHYGPKIIFWCGSDVLNLTKNTARFLGGKHICENQIEQAELAKYGIQAEIRPMLFDAAAFKEIVHFTPSSTPHVYLSAHKKSEEEYGILFIEGIAWVVPEVTFHIYGISGKSHDNIMYHGFVPSEQFDKEIKNYHAALRWNKFDGFAETLAKSALLGQYPISRIYYPHIYHAPDEKTLIKILRGLKYKTEPNYKLREYWLKKLNVNLEELV